MRSKIFSITLLLLFAACTAISPAASAWEKGHVKINPSFEYEQQWDSNIFWTEDNEKDDFISLFIPAVESEIGFGQEGKHKFINNYRAELAAFADHSDQNYGNHDLYNEVYLDLNDYFIKVNNNFKFTSSRAGTEFQRRNLRKENLAEALVGVDFNKISWDLGYSHFIVDYLSDTLEDFNRYENSVWTTGYLQVAPKSKVLAEFKWKNIDYEKASGRDGNAFRGMIGIKGDITSKLTGIIKGGYKYKTYDDSDNKDFSNAVAHIDLLYAMNDRTDFAFSYNREPFESTYTNNNYYVGDHFMMNANYKFGGNWMATAKGKYFHNFYPEEDNNGTERRDHEWSVGGKLQYFWKEYIVAGAGYDFQQRDSNVTGRSYDDHLIHGDIKVMF